MTDPDSDGWIIADGSAWVIDGKHDELRRLGPDLRTPVATPVTGVGADVGDLQLIDGVLWLSDHATDTVTRIAPAAL